MITLMLLLADVDMGSRLDLVCIGAGSANKQTHSSFDMDTTYDGSAWGNMVGNQSVPFDDQLNLWIKGEEGRLRMPRVMLPVIKGGDNGWFKIKNIKISRNEITGSVAVNFINKPKFRIDRQSGYISMSGKSGHYSGSCQKYDPSPENAKF